MTKAAAITEAQKIANKEHITMLVYRDPIGSGEQEGFDTPWMFGPLSQAKYSPHREKEHDTIIKPE